VKLWPTPVARDYKGGRKPETLAKAGRKETNSLPDAAKGSLNPEWVETLMGFPIGWTATDGPPLLEKNNTTGSRLGWPQESKTGFHG
jgi:hypothetical protein